MMMTISPEQIEKERLWRLARFCHAFCPLHKPMPKLSQPEWEKELEAWFGPETVQKAREFLGRGGAD